MSINVQDDNTDRGSSTPFTVAPPQSNSPSKKLLSQASKGHENSLADTGFGQNPSGDAFGASMYQEELNSFLSKEGTQSGVTLDKLLGNTFQEIDLYAIKDCSQELFPSRPASSRQRAKVRVRKSNRTEGSFCGMKDTKEEEDSKYCDRIIDEQDLKGSNDFSSILPSLNGGSQVNITYRPERKQSQKSIESIRDGRDSQGSFYGERKRKASQDKMVAPAYRIKAIVSDKNTYSPSPPKMTNKYIQDKRNAARKRTELDSISPTRSVEYSGFLPAFDPPRGNKSFALEPKKASPIKPIHNKPEEIVKDLNFGIEGRAIGCSIRRGIYKPMAFIPFEKSRERNGSLSKVNAREGSVGKSSSKILEMLNESGIMNKEIRTSKLKHEKILGEADMRTEQWELFQKYGARFGIKPQDYFGVKAINNSGIQHKRNIESQNRSQKSLSPFSGRKGYRDGLE